MGKSLLVFGLWCACATLAFAQAVAEGRVALVIGNASYRTSPLSNPIADARLMEQALREVGFDVVRAENVGRRDMVRLVRELGNRIKAAGGVGLFYFAGHGVQIRGENYLVSTDAEMRSEEEVADDSLAAQSILERMSASGSRVNILVLDACRNNPFAARIRAIRGGLASMSAPAGSLVAFSTAPGEVASDGLIGTHGLYTAHLVRNIREPGLRVEEVLKRTRAAVLRDSGNQQTPWENSALLGDFYFKPPVEVDTASRPGPSSTELLELAFWGALKGTPSTADYEEYLRQFPNGTFSGLARSRLLQKDAEVAALAPARPTEPALLAPIRLSKPTPDPGPLFSKLSRTGDQLFFLDSDPISGAPIGMFTRVVTHHSEDALQIDDGQLTIRRPRSVVLESGRRAELIEYANDGLGRRGSWPGRFYPANRQFGDVALTFTYSGNETRTAEGVQRSMVRARLSGFASNEAVPGAAHSARAVIRGHALIDEDSGMVFEFELLSEHPHYALRRQWFGATLVAR